MYIEDEIVLAKTCISKSNWLWFRVLVNLALVRVLSVFLEEAKHYVDDNLNTFYIAHEGSGDDPWCD